MAAATTGSAGLVLRGVIAIIAHIMGYAMDATIAAGWIQSSWTPELRADAWAGCALAKAGLSTNGMKSAVTALYAYPPASKPEWSRRLPVLQQGYTQCGGNAFPP
jgi:hypothetical protein